MKYFMNVFRGFVMAGDVLVLSVSVFAIFFSWDIFPLNIIMWIMVAMTFDTWKKSGGFIAWDFKKKK